MNPNTIVVLQSGAPYALPWVQRVPAIIEGWFAGEESADAIAEVLLGETNPSGKLPMTFPQRIEDSPAYLYYSDGPDANYGEGVFVGYRYFDRRHIEPLFPFGYGLSYTTFDYRNLTLAPAAAGAGGNVEVSVDVVNTGQRAGAETVQLYVVDRATTEVVRPVKELKAFRKISLRREISTRALHTRAARFLVLPDRQARMGRDAWTPRHPRGQLFARHPPDTRLRVFALVALLAFALRAVRGARIAETRADGEDAPVLSLRHRAGSRSVPARPHRCA